MYVTIGALVLLIVALIAIGVMLTKMNTYSVFPPTKNACPDYWDVSSNPNYCGVYVENTTGKNTGNISIDTTNKNVYRGSANNIGFCNSNNGKFGCKNAVNSGSGQLNLKGKDGNSKFQYANLGDDNPLWNSADGLYPGKSTICAQREWANLMGITWDGVSNYNGC